MIVRANSTTAVVVRSAPTVSGVEVRDIVTEATRAFERSEVPAPGHVLSATWRKIVEVRESFANSRMARAM